jgi:hypothetical protein
MYVLRTPEEESSVELKSATCGKKVTMPINKFGHFIYALRIPEMVSSVTQLSTQWPFGTTMEMSSVSATSPCSPQIMYT